VAAPPAGMTLLPKSQLLVGVQPIYGRLQFHPDSANKVAGTDGGNALIPLPGGSFFFVYGVSDRLKVGFGTFAYFGGVTEFNLNWAGRFHLQGAVLLGDTFMPAVAYRINDWLSVGAGLNIMLGFLKEKVGILNITSPINGQARYKDITAGVGGDIGILLQPTEKTRVGLTYLTPVNLNFGDVPHFSGLGPVLIGLFKKRGFFGANVDLGMTVPQGVSLSIYHQLSDTVALLGDANWQNWSQFGDVGISVNSQNPRSLTQNLNYNDTWSLAGGVQWKAVSNWLLSAGFRYDSSMVSDSTRTVTAPIGSQYRWTAGAQYALNEHDRFGFAEDFMWSGDFPLTQGRGPNVISGQFTNTFINFFVLSYIHTF